MPFLKATGVIPLIADEKYTLLFASVFTLKVILFGKNIKEVILPATSFPTWIKFP